MDFNDGQWIHGESVLNVTNKSDKWILFKVKTTMDKMATIFVVPNKGFIRPRDTLTLQFKVRNLSTLTNGENPVKILFKWNGFHIETESCSFEGLENTERFTCVIRKDVAFPNPGGEKKVEDQVKTIMMKFVPHVAKIQNDEVPEVPATIEMDFLSKTWILAKRLLMFLVFIVLLRIFLRLSDEKANGVGAADQVNMQIQGHGNGGGEKNSLDIIAGWLLRQI